MITHDHLCECQITMPGNKNSGRKKNTSTTPCLSPTPSNAPRGRPRNSTKNETVTESNSLPQTPIADGLSDQQDAKYAKPYIPPLNIRTSATSRGWDQAVGSAIDIIPSSKLPTNRIILKRYRAMRVENPNGDMATMAVKIADEVLPIWALAPRIPVLSVMSVQRNITSLIRKHLDIMPASRHLVKF